MAAASTAADRGIGHDFVHAIAVEVEPPSHSRGPGKLEGGVGARNDCNGSFIGSQKTLNVAMAGALATRPTRLTKPRSSTAAAKAADDGSSHVAPNSPR